MVDGAGVGEFKGRQAGFTLMEILVGLCVLALAFICLTAYSKSQLRGLTKSNQLSDASQTAATALETLKGQLQDSLYFKKMFNQAGSRPVIKEDKRTLNSTAYGVKLTLTRAPSPLYALKVRADICWDSKHSLALGMLYPGATDAL